MNLLEKILTHDYFDEVSLVIALGCFILTTVALAQFIPLIVGSVSFSIFCSICVGKVWIERRVIKTETKTETKIIPYDAWPDSCVACGEDIPDSMELRGQFAVHRNESTSGTKSGGLCNECTRTYSTLVDNHTHLVDVYDKSEEPVEL